MRLSASSLRNNTKERNAGGETASWSTNGEGKSVLKRNKFLGSGLLASIKWCWKSQFSANSFPLAFLHIGGRRLIAVTSELIECKLQ